MLHKNQPKKNCFVYVDEEMYNILYTQILLEISNKNNF